MNSVARLPVRGTNNPNFREYQEASLNWYNELYLKN